MNLDGQAGEILARLLRELGSQLDAHDREAAVEHRPRRLAGRASDLQQTCAGREAGELDEVVEQGFGIVRPGGVVEVGGRVERAAQRLAHLLAR